MERQFVGMAYFLPIFRQIIWCYAIVQLTDGRRFMSDKTFL